MATTDDDGLDDDLYPDDRRPPQTTDDDGIDPWEYPTTDEDGKRIEQAPPS